MEFTECNLIINVTVIFQRKQSKTTKKSRYITKINQKRLLPSYREEDTQ